MKLYLTVIHYVLSHHTVEEQIKIKTKIQVLYGVISFQLRGVCFLCFYPQVAI